MGRDLKKLTDAIGGDVQAERIIVLASQEPLELRERWLQQLFDTQAQALGLGDDYAAFLNRLQRHPTWGLAMDVIAADDQARRIAQHLNSFPPEARETEARKIFDACESRLGKAYPAFRERLTPFLTTAQEGTETDGTPISSLTALLNGHALSTIKATGCQTIEALIERHGERDLLMQKNCGRTSLRRIVEALKTLGFQLRTD